MPRFLLHHIIFDHGLVDGLRPHQPRRKDWIQLRKIALSKWVTLLVQEVAAYTWCTECEHLRSGTCPEERRAKWAHVGWSPWHRCACKIYGPCTGRPDSSSDFRTRTQGVGPRRGLELLPERAGTSAFVTAYRTVPDWCHLTGCDISLHAVRNFCAPSAFWFRNQQQRSFNVAGSQVWSRCSGTEFAVRGACLLVQAAVSEPTMAEREIILEAIAELPEEAVPARWHTAKRSALRSETGCATATVAVVITAHKVASGPRNKHCPTSHHLLTIISPPNHTHF